MKCPKCHATLHRVMVAVAGAKQKAMSFQCPKCEYFTFDTESARKIVAELSQTPLRMQQKVIKLSADRLGMYFNKNVVQSLGLKAGEEISVCVPDKKHIVIEIE